MLAGKDPAKITLFNIITFYLREKKTGFGLADWIY
jgi:hypothetical protein